MYVGMGSVTIVIMPAILTIDNLFQRENFPSLITSAKCKKMN